MIISLLETSVVSSCKMNSQKAMMVKLTEYELTFLFFWS